MWRKLIQTGSITVRKEKMAAKSLIDNADSSITAANESPQSICANRALSR